MAEKKEIKKKMEQNKTDLYDFIRTLDEECRNVDLSDVPQTGEKIEVNDGKGAKAKIRLTAAQKAALKAVFVPYCRHSRLNYDGDVKICGLKEHRERCEYSTWDTWADCPSDCPHHILRTKVSCTPDKCAIADKFVDEVRAALSQ